MFRILFVLLAAVAPTLAHTAVCSPGYWLDGGGCSECSYLYFCPGDDTRKACIDFIAPEYIRSDVDIAAVISGQYGNISADECLCRFQFLPGDETRTNVYKTGSCVAGPDESHPGWNAYSGCRTGYYAIGGPTGDTQYKYTGCAPCTNAPENAVYIGFGTPLIDGEHTIGNNCPWKCTDGYKINSDGTACDKLCTLGFTKLNTSTGIVVPLYEEKRTTPSINIGDVNGAWHADLELGRATGAINVMYNGEIYHTISPTTVLQCNAGYWLTDNGVCEDCGKGYYCPGDNTRRACRDTLPTGTPVPTSISSLTNNEWGGDYTHASAPEHCRCWWYGLSDERRTNYFIETVCQDGMLPEKSIMTSYTYCRPGYYAIKPLYMDKRYRDCAPCDNGPENSHYTSYSTPSVMYAVESNCPWECDDGYTQVGNECVAE